MAKAKTPAHYEKKIRELIESRTGKACEPWLDLMIEKTAWQYALVAKMSEEVLKIDLVLAVSGSMQQQKYESNPLLDKYDKAQRTLTADLTALSLTYAANPSKVTETTKSVEDDDPMMAFYAQAKK